MGLEQYEGRQGRSHDPLGHPCFLRDLVPLLDADILLVEGGKTIGWLPRILCFADHPEL